MNSEGQLFVYERELFGMLRLIVKANCCGVAAGAIAHEASVGMRCVRDTLPLFADCAASVFKQPS